MKGLTLESILREAILPAQFRNTQCRVIAGGCISDDEDADERDLETAKRNLQSHFAFGFAEDFDAGIEAIRRTCGFGIPKYRDLNQGKRGYANRLLTPELEAEILSYNDLDRRLVLHGEHTFRLRHRRMLRTI